MLYHSILIGGKPADFFSESDLNAIAANYNEGDNSSLRGSIGSRPAQSVRNLRLPCTDRNNQIYAHFYDTASVPISAENEPMTVIIQTAAFQTLQGFGVLRLAEISTQPSYYELDFWADTGDWTELLADVSLRDLAPYIQAMGYTAFDAPTIQASMAGSYSTGFPFAYYPVLYDFIPDLTKHHFGQLRPHLYFRTLCDAAFTLAGITVASTFYDTEYFKKWTHIWTFGDFGIGYDKAYEQTGIWAVSEFDIFSGTPNAGVNLIFSQEDDANGFFNIATGIYTVAQTASYIIEVSGQWTVKNGAAKFKYLINGVLTGGIPDTQYEVDTETTFVFPEGNGRHRTETAILSVGDTIQLTAWFSPDFFGADYFGGTIKVKIYRSPEYSIGEVINWVDILPNDVRFLDFFDGVKHFFNLYFQFNSALRLLEFEPRHGDTLTHCTGAGLVITENYTPFFRSDLPAIDYTDRIDTLANNRKINFSNIDRRVFMRHKEDNGDYYANKRRSEKGDSNVGAAQWHFSQRFNKGILHDDNPYFSTTMHAIAFDGDANNATTRNLVQYCVLRQDADNDSQRDLTARRYRFVPKAAFYHGIFPGAILSDTCPTPNSYPLAYATWYLDPTAQAANGSYADEHSYLVPPATTTAGLFQKFYLQHFSIMQRGVEWSPLHARFNELLMATFSKRRLWRLFTDTDTSAGAWLFMHYEGYSGVREQNTQFRLQLYHVPTAENYAQLQPTTGDTLTSPPPQSISPCAPIALTASYDDCAGLLFNVTGSASFVLWDTLTNTQLVAFQGLANCNYSLVAQDTASGCLSNVVPLTITPAPPKLYDYEGFAPAIMGVLGTGCTCSIEASATAAINGVGGNAYNGFNYVKCVALFVQSVIYRETNSYTQSNPPIYSELSPSRIGRHYRLSAYIKVVSFVPFATSSNVIRLRPTVMTDKSVVSETIANPAIIGIWQYIETVVMVNTCPNTLSINIIVLASVAFDVGSEFHLDDLKVEEIC